MTPADTTGAASQCRDVAPVAQRRYSVDAMLAHFEAWLLEHGRGPADSRRLAVVRSMLKGRRT